MDCHMKNEKSTQMSLVKTDVLQIMVAAAGYDTNNLLRDILRTRMGTEHLGEIIEQILTLVRQPAETKNFSILQVKLAVQRALLEYKLQGSHPEVRRLIPNNLETCGVIDLLQGLKDMIDTHSGEEERNNVSDRCSTNNATVVSLTQGRILCEPQQQRMETDTSGIDHVIQRPNVQQNNHHNQSDYETASQLVQLAQPQDLGSGTNPYQFSSSTRPTDGSMLQLLNSPQTPVYFPGGLGKPHQQFDGRSEDYVAQTENRSRDNGTTTDSQARLRVTDSDKSSSTPDSDKSCRSRTDKGDDPDCTAYRVTVEEPSIRFYETDMNFQLKLQKQSNSKDEVPLFSSLLPSENMVDKTTHKVEYSEFAGKVYGGETSSLIRDCNDEDNDATPSCSFIIRKPQDVKSEESNGSLEIDLESYDDETHGKKDFSNMVAQEMEVSTSVHQSDHDPQRLERCNEDQLKQDVSLQEADITSLSEADMARGQQQSVVHSNGRHSNWFITHKCRFCKDLSNADFKYSETVRQLPKSTRLDKIRHHISTLKPKVKRGSPQRKSISNVFQIPFSGGQAHRVCRDTFVKFFGICRDTVGRLSHGLPTARLDKTEHISIDGVDGVRDIDDDPKPAQMERAGHIEENHGNVLAQSDQEGSSAGEDKETSIPLDQVGAILRNNVKNFMESKVRCLPANNDYCRKKYVYYSGEPHNMEEAYENERGKIVDRELFTEVAHSIGFLFENELSDKVYGSQRSCRICRVLKQKVQKETDSDRWQQQLFQHQQSAERMTSYCQHASQGGEGDPEELVFFLSLVNCTQDEYLPPVLGVIMYDIKRRIQSDFVWEYIWAGFGTQELLSCLLCYLKDDLEELCTHRLVLVTEPYGGLLRNTDFIVFGLWLMVHLDIEELRVIYQYHGHWSDTLPHPDSTQVGDVTNMFIAQSTAPFKPVHDIIGEWEYIGLICMTSDMMFDMSALKGHLRCVNWEEIQVSLNTTRCLHMTRHESECVVTMEKYFYDKAGNTIDDNCVAEYHLPLLSGDNKLLPLYPSGHRIPVEYYNLIREIYPWLGQYYKTHANVNWSDTSKAIPDPTVIIQEMDSLDDDDDDDVDD